MRARSIAAVATATIALGLALVQPAAVASGPSATKSAEKVLGFLQGYPGDCPPAEAPEEPLVCHEVVLAAWRIGTNDAPGTMAPPKTSWVLSVVQHTLTFPGGGGDPTESDVVEGFTTHPLVTFDRQHLTSAHLVAAGVAMSDGSTMDVDATWTATSARLHYGNDGPSLAEFGHVRHQHEVCLNALYQAHQKFRLAHVHAVLNGVASEDLSTFAFLAYNHFTSLEVHPARCRR
ncbi:MAG: hypothetical protein ACJ72D_18650 [Marmoricola sp.]